jgi:hypothetical protein
MNFKTEFYKASISEMILLSIVMLILLNGLVFLIFTLIFQVPFIELFNKTWIILIFIPLFQGIIQPLINRKGLLKIENNNLQIVNKKIEELLSLKGYIKTSENNNYDTFEFKSNWKKIYSIPNHQVTVKTDESFIEITGKRNVLMSLESKIKWNKEINNKT